MINFYRKGELIRVDGKLFMVLKVNKKTVNLREVFATETKDHINWKMGEFFTLYLAKEKAAN